MTERGINLDVCKKKTGLGPRHFTITIPLFARWQRRTITVAFSDAKALYNLEPREMAWLLPCDAHRVPRKPAAPASINKGHFICL
jgi:hypothetical protein